MVRRVSLSVAIIDALLASGATREQIAAAVKADIAEREAVATAKLEKKRAGNRERQQRKRENDRNAESRVTGVTERDPSPNEINNLTPTREKNTGAKAPCKKFVWTCPDGVHPDHWRDFLRNRRTKSLTNSETAYRGQLKALAEIADDEWPPGRLVQYAAEKGWGSINDPRKSRYGQSASNVTSLRGHRPDPALDLLRAARAAEDREDHWRARASLPSLGPG